MRPLRCEVVTLTSDDGRSRQVLRLARTAAVMPLEHVADTAGVSCRRLRGLLAEPQPRGLCDAMAAAAAARDPQARLKRWSPPPVMRVAAYDNNLRGHEHGPARWAAELRLIPNEKPQEMVALFRASWRNAPPGCLKAAARRAAVQAVQQTAISFIWGHSPLTLLARAAPGPPAMLDALIGSEIAAVRHGAALNPASGPVVLAAASTDPETKVRCIAAARVDTPDAVYAALVCDSDTEVVGIAARRADPPAGPFDMLTRHMSRDVRAFTAHNSACLPQTLQRLAADVDGMVRGAAASNPDTPQDTLSALAGDNSVAVRLAVASNPHIPQDALPGLVEDVSEGVRKTARRAISERR